MSELAMQFWFGFTLGVALMLFIAMVGMIYLATRKGVVHEREKPTKEQLEGAPTKRVRPERVPLDELPN